jgi:hypothetical protein
VNIFHIESNPAEDARVTGNLASRFVLLLGHPRPISVVMPEVAVRKLGVFVPFPEQRYGQFEAIVFDLNAGL